MSLSESLNLLRDQAIAFVWTAPIAFGIERVPVEENPEVRRQQLEEHRVAVQSTLSRLGCE